MTSKAALCKALLDGKVISIKTGFTWFGLTNIPREVGRSVERSFGVTVTRIPMAGKSRYGQPCNWVNYSLEKNEFNKDGIEKMKAYVEKQLIGNKPDPKEIHNPLFQ